ncbi:PilZ domain-containing protein [Geovibrio thiophilus]|uniref:PilZ domain-containing protein n=1 Tax=Geovibrio thiophilus TaxID=139438 RepID=A0A3R5UTI6_9BACT|nr:PilZ domain-containing protein [Geovibrio thiophilus]QAR32087.1 PilZ domain-containing protein [Geovibrio thiophilus]
MLKDCIFEKGEFISVFSGYYENENGAAPDHEILFGAGQFFDNCFTDIPGSKPAEDFSNAVRDAGQNGQTVVVPLTRAIAWALCRICDDIKNSPVKQGSHARLLEALELLRKPLKKLETTDGSEVRDMFRFIKNNDTTAKLLNSYKGLRVFHSAEILEICGDDRIIMQVHPEQIKALEIEGYTCITHKLLPQQITADVKSMDSASGVVEFVNLVILKKPFDRRKIYRLQPEKPITAVLFAEGNRTEVEIVDVSLRGISLRLRENTVGSESEVRISFTLPLDEGKEMILRGKLKYIFCEEICKMGLETFPDHSQEALIKRYLIERMKKIEKELT